MTKQWFRIVTNAEGAITSCVAVEQAEQSTNHVFYVRAQSEESARYLGKEAFNTYYRERLRARREKLRVEGKCQCGRPRDTKANLCSVCTRGNQVARERTRLRSEGFSVPSPDKTVTLRIRREGEANELRREVLEEVLVAYNRRTKTPWSFVAWLANEIKKLKEAAKVEREQRWAVDRESDKSAAE